MKSSLFLEQETQEGRKREAAVYFASIGSTGNWKAGSERLLFSYMLIPPSSLNHAVLDVTSSCVMTGRERERDYRNRYCIKKSL